MTKPHMRAKFVCYAETRHVYGSIQYKLQPVGGDTPENKAFFNTTPAGNIEVTLKPGETSARLVLGDVYYIDFTKAEA